MKISEFIQQNKIDDTCNPIVEKLIEQALSKLHELYGTEGNCYCADSWALEELSLQENSIDQLPETFIDDVNYYTLEMSNSIKLSMYAGDGLFKYENRPLFKLNGKIVVDSTIYSIPIILALHQLITIYDQLEPNVEVIYRSTRLMEVATTCQLLVQLNLNWICEQSRNTDHKGVDKRNKEFDAKPVNIVRKKALMQLAYDYAKDRDFVPVDHLVKVLKEPYFEALTQMYHQNIITDDQVTDDQYVAEISDALFKRWLFEFKLSWDLDPKNRNNIIK